MPKTKLVIIITISLLAAAAIGFSVECFLLATKLNSVKTSLKAQETNVKAAVFAKLFVDKVLLQTGTISFEDRLQLENAVRDINDTQIFSEWQKLTASGSDSETQQIVGNIIKLLINKISPQISPR